MQNLRVTGIYIKLVVEKALLCMLKIILKKKHEFFENVSKCWIP